MLEMISDLIAIERGRDEILQETQYLHKYFSETEQKKKQNKKTEKAKATILW